MEDLFKPNRFFEVYIGKVYIAYNNDWKTSCFKVNLCLKRQMCWFYIAQPLSGKHATMIYCEFLGDVLNVVHRGIFHLRALKGT